jgi:hypothetical protein
MKKNYTLLMFFVLTAFGSLKAQIRYIDQVFSDVAVEKGVTYGTNISILTGTPAPLALKMDVYTPVGDTETNRPVVIYFHTGSFLPPLISGGITGSLSDSTLVEICSRLARMGYTAIAATYRQGWLPTATDENVRRSTLLQAAYRGIIDARTCIRFLRKSVAESNNPFGIDVDRIALWGQGTGGYISYGAAYLDRYEELIVEKFINTETGNPYVTLQVDGDPYGLTQSLLNIPNHTEYSSDFRLAVNMGGALGDINWIEDSASAFQPASVGYHVVSDPFAPFGNGPVIVPTTREFVVNVAGTLTSTQRINDVGANDVLQPILAQPDPLTQFVSFVKQAGVTVDLSPLGGSPTTPLATDHMYPFITAGVQSGPWDWWNKATLDLVVAGFNAATMQNLSSDVLHANGLLTNPDMSAEKGKAYVDTIIAYYAPRGCLALDLTSCKEALGINAVKRINEISDFTVFPNPATDQINIKFSLLENAQLNVYLFNAQGQIVKTQYLGRLDSGNHNFQLSTYNLPVGIYTVTMVNSKGEINSTRLVISN